MTDQAEIEKRIAEAGMRAKPKPTPAALASLKRNCRRNWADPKARNPRAMATGNARASRRTSRKPLTSSLPVRGVHLRPGFDMGAEFFLMPGIKRAHRFLIAGRIAHQRGGQAIGPRRATGVSAPPACGWHLPPACAAQRSRPPGWVASQSQCRGSSVTSRARHPQFGAAGLGASSAGGKRGSTSTTGRSPGRRSGHRPARRDRPGTGCRRRFAQSRKRQNSAWPVFTG